MGSTKRIIWDLSSNAQNEPIILLPVVQFDDQSDQAQAASETICSLTSWSTASIPPSATAACQWYLGACRKILGPSNNGKGCPGSVGYTGMASSAAYGTNVPTSST